ncbi:ATP-binding protein [Bacillus sp. CGMCC 1.16607]|uniref:ATP-binding response regulator n=1 Tax=Bacillus sp. CGMCC 1.16607 TaxID=3351842 RepID=UPI003628F33D
MFSKTKITKSIFSKILVFSLMLSLIPFTVFGIYNYALVSKLIKGNNDDQIHQQVKQTVQEKMLSLEKETESINLKLEQVEANLQMIQKQVEYLYSKKEKIPLKEIELTEDPKGFLWQPYKNRYMESNMFVSARSRNLKDLNRELMVIKEMDTIFKEVYKNSAIQLNLWFCHSNSAIISYPSFDFKAKIDAGEGQPDLDVRKYPFYKVSDEYHNLTRTITWTAPYKEFTFNSAWVVSATAPIYSDKQELIGVVGVDVPLQYLSGILNVKYKEENTYNFVIDHEGNFIAGNKNREIKTTPYNLDKFMTGNHIPVNDYSMIRRNLESNKQVKRIIALNDKYYLLSKEIKSNKWIYNMVIPEREILDPIILSTKTREKKELTEFFEKLIVTTLISSLFIIMLAYVFFRHITIPMHVLKIALTDLANGKYYQIPIRKWDEIGQLTSSYNDMNMTIQTLLKNLNKRADELDSKKKELELSNKALVDTNQKLRELEEAKSELVMQLSHDLKTPITSVQGYLEMLEIYDLPTSDRDEFINILKIKLNHITDLIDDLYIVSQLTSPLEEYHKEPIFIDMLLDHSIELASTQASKKDIKIDRVYEEHLPYSFVDPKKMNRAFYNILVNAIKYSKHEIVEIQVNVYTVDHKSIFIEIKDFGIGISNDNLSKVFNKFFREGRIQNIKNGTGLGMSITKAIIEAHNGTIQIESKIQEYTLVKIILPLENS